MGYHETVEIVTNMDRGMNHLLTNEILHELRRILRADCHNDLPVVKAVSLEFWENLKAWIYHISQSPEPFTIALAGGSGSGKSMVREVLVSALARVTDVSAFTQDNYYRDFAADFPHWRLDEFYHRIDFDDPEHIQFDQLVTDLKHLKTLRYGQTLHIPKLIYGTPEAKPTSVPQGLGVPIKPFIVTEGIHAFYDEELRSLYDFMIYVDVDEDSRRSRWLQRNQLENRGTTDNMWQTTVECLQTHILPNRNHADLVINNVAPLEQVTHFINQVVQLLHSAAKSAA
jgi:uridine kinase